MNIIENKIRKAVFPVAGLGTRFLPITKAVPKEMLPIVDKPVIHFAFDEAIACGFEELIFIVNPNKQAIKDYFVSNPELENKLAAENKMDLLSSIRNFIPPNITCTYVTQHSPAGLGDAILCARDAIGKEPFAVFLPDDLIYTKQKTCMQQMLDVYALKKSSVLAIEKISPSDAHLYGMVGVGKNNNLEYGDITKITDIIEKPNPEKSPSLYASIGRYIFTPQLFRFLEKVKTNGIGEILMTDATYKLLHDEDVYGLVYVGKRFDCGTKLGYLKAVVEFGLSHLDIGADFGNILKKLGKNI